MKTLFLNIFLINCLMFFNLTCMAFLSETDSLASLIQNDKEDSNKVYHLNLLASKLHYSMPDSAIKLSLYALDLSTKIKWKKGISASYTTIGDVYYYQSNNKEAIVYYLKALKQDENSSNQKGIITNYINIGLAYSEQGMYEMALKYYVVALTKSRQLGYEEDIVKCLGNIGNVYVDKGGYSQATDYFLKALKIAKFTGNKNFIASILGNLGNIAYYQGNYMKATEHYFEALKINEALENPRGIARHYGNIGSVFYHQDEYLKALEYYNKALKINEDLCNNQGIVYQLRNIGSVYFSLKDYPLAVEYYNRALKIDEEAEYLSGMSSTYGNLGVLYMEVKDYPKAEEYYNKALKIDEELEDLNSVARHLGNIGFLNICLGNYKKAENMLKRGLKITQKIGAMDTEMNLHSNLSELYEKTSNYLSSLEHFIHASVLKDSIFNKEKINEITRFELKYEFEKKEAVANAEHKKEIENQNALALEKSRKQKIVIFFVIFGFLIVSFFAALIFRSLRITRKQKKIIEKQKNEVDEINVQLNQQNEEILTQRDEIQAQRDAITAQHELVSNQKEHIEKIHKEVSDSINYATRLQYAVLPDIATLQNTVSDCMVIYMPKDKVSGDFYWWAVIEKHLVIAVADCTGHGVPGAFMSMLGISFLREIVLKEYMTNPAIILKRLRKEIIKALKQSSENNSGLSPSVKDIPSQISSASAVNIPAKTDVKDGMDMSLISINTETLEAQFAGAYNPAYIIKGKELTEIKGDKMPVAIFEKMNNFTQTNIQLKKGDIIYMASDGFQDQFGGPDNKKMNRKKLRQSLTDVSGYDMHTQKKLLEDILAAWKNNNKQTDDITIAGIKI